MRTEDLPQCPICQKTVALICPDDLEKLKNSEKRLSQAEAELKEWRDDQASCMNERCGDEVHCTCVPSLRRRLSHLMDVAEGLIWYSIDTDFHDNNPLQGIEHYKKYKKEFEDKESPWYQRKHMGDCTQEPNSCATCQIEEIEKQVKLIAEWDGIKDGGK
jgi:3-methyladenine DNA glycosylase AlkD